MRNDNTVSVRNIYPGTHTVRVMREMKNKSGWNLRIGGPRTETIYAIKATLRDGYDFDIVVNRFGKVLIDERRIDPGDDWYSDDDDDRYDNRNDRNDRDNRNYEMTDADFNQAKESLRKDWFENTRLTTARQIIDKNYFTSRQVKDLMLLFTFENNRLDIAKYAYSKTVDKGNYFIVNDALSSTSKKEELNLFIHDQQ
jgi:hypothetical protein